jgi:hypothetical protein
VQAEAEMAEPEDHPPLIMLLVAVEGPVAIMEPVVEVRMPHTQLGGRALAAMVLVMPVVVVVPLLALAERRQAEVVLAY